MTYQQEAQQKAREKGGLDYTGKKIIFYEDDLDQVTTQTITNLLDEIDEVIGEEEKDININPFIRQGYNTLHQKLTNKLNQLRV